VNEKKHGLGDIASLINVGVMVYRDGRLCQGSWQNDRKYGECYETFPNGDAFHGLYVNGKQQGKLLLDLQAWESRLIKMVNATRASG
jgi:hypothetical protein